MTWWSMCGISYLRENAIKKKKRLTGVSIFFLHLYLLESNHGWVSKGQLKGILLDFHCPGEREAMDQNFWVREVEVARNEIKLLMEQELDTEEEIEDRWASAIYHSGWWSDRRIAVM